MKDFFGSISIRPTQYFILMLSILSGAGIHGVWADNKTRSLPENYEIIKQLDDFWQVYDTKYEAHVPYIKQRHGSLKAAGFWLNTQEFAGFQLLLYTQANTYLFVNHSLCKSFKTDSWIEIDIDSLAGVFDKSELFISLYDQREYRLPTELLFVAKRIRTQTKKVKKNDEEIKKNKKTFNNNQFSISSQIKSFAVTAFLFLLSIVALLRNLFPKNFRVFYTFRSIFNPLGQDNTFVTAQNPLSVNGWFILSNALLAAGFYVLTQEKMMNIFRFNVAFSYKEDSFLQLASDYGILAGIIFLIFMLKYVVLVVLSLPLQPRTLANTHFYECIRLNNLFYIAGTLLLVIYVTGSLKSPETGYREVTYLTASFHILQSILLSFYVNKHAQTKNLYLFYYLCLAELAPLLIGLKFLLFE